MNKPVVPRLSYATPEDPWLKQKLIQALEYLTGKYKIQGLYDALDEEQRQGGAFWAAALQALDIELKYDSRQFAKIPPKGPLILIANHPFGVLDGLIICHLATEARGSFYILTNSVLCTAKELEPYLLPVDFSPTKTALRTNIETKNRAVKQLKAGGTVVIFPAGEVSTSYSLFGKAHDAEWKTFTARLIHEAKANVVPVFFHGQNSRIFHWASQLHLTLRLSLLLHEVKNKMGKTIQLSIGDPITYAHLQHLKNRHALMQFLRHTTYGLAAEGPA
ncbi:MAG: hypothetical protein D6730_23560 [Bacteroidetes bacterium]|nr:MAG: hypothetical protein D6730_23560 [Bacteroidota bacterium]